MVSREPDEPGRGAPPSSPGLVGRLVEALIAVSIRHPWWVVAITLVLSVIAGAGVPSIEMRLDGRSLIPRHHPDIQDSDRAAERFGLRDVVVVAVADETDGIYDPESLGHLVELSAELAAVEGIVGSSVRSLATVPRLFIEADTFDQTPLLQRGAVDAETARRIERETRLLGLDDGVLVARDGRAAAVYAEVEDEADRYAVWSAVRSLAERHGVGDDAVWFSGNAMAQAVLGRSAALDLVRLVPLVILVITVILIVAFRHPVPALVSLAEIGASLAWTAGLLAATGKPVFITTLVLPVILMVIGVSDDIYALNRLVIEARRRPGAPIGEIVHGALTAVSGPILLTSATTVVGLLSLAATSLEPQRIFGLYGGLAIVFSTLCTFTLVPALLVLTRPRLGGAAPPVTRLGQGVLERMLGWIDRLGPVPITVALGALALTAFALTAQVRIEDNWIRNLPPRSATVQGDQAINRLLAGTNTLELMVDSGRRHGFFDPERFRALGELETRLADHPHTGAIASVYGDVVRVLASLEDVPYATYRERLARGEQELTGAQIEQAVLLLESAGSAPVIDRLDEDYRRVRLTVFVREANFSRIASVLERAREATAELLGPEAGPVAFGDGWISYLTVRLLVVGQVRSIALAILFDTFLLAVLFGSLGVALLAVAPVVLSVFLVFASLAITGTPLGSANSMFAAIAFGVGIDYSIHLVASWRNFKKLGWSSKAAARTAILEAGPAILVSAVAISFGFALLGVSETLPNRQLGWLVALTMGVCAVMTLWMVPTLTRLRDRGPDGGGTDGAGEGS